MLTAPRLLAAATVTLGALVVVLVLGLTGALHRFELLSVDARLAAGLGCRPPGGDVIVAWIDQESMDELRRREVSFPWPRSLYGEVARYLVDAGAKVLVFDILFSEPGDADHDRAFGEFLAGVVDVQSAKFVQFRDGGFTPAETERFLARGLPASGLPPLPPQRGIVLPIPEIEAAADWLGFVNVRPDADKVHRHYDLVRVFRGRAYPSLALAAAMAACGERTLQIEGGAVRVGTHPIPIDAGGRIALAFRGPEFTFEHIKVVNIAASAEQLAAGQEPLYPPARFKDKIVIFGINAEGYEDIAATPLSRVFPGPELHATALDNLLRGDPLREPPLGLPLAILGALTGALLVFLLPGTLLPAAACVVAALVVVIGAALAMASGVVVPVAAPLLGLALAGGGAFLYRLVVEGKSRRELRRAFTSYMAPEVVAEVLRDPERVRLGGQTRSVTLFFSDLRGFTSLAEGLPPEDLVAFLNDYFTRMGDHVMAEGGVIDKFIGDGIMAIFGAPLDQDDHPGCAVRAALAAQKELVELNRELAARGRPPIGMRIGIHSGPAVVGNMGSRRRFDYTAMGDTVNLASRLEGANKAFGTSCLVSAAAWETARRTVLGREVGLVRVVGREAPITVHEPLGRAGDGDPLLLSFLSRYNAGLAALRGGDRAGAGQLLQEALGSRPGDPVTRRYLERLAEPAWDGVFTLESK